MVDMPDDGAAVDDDDVCIGVIWEHFAAAGHSLGKSDVLHLITGEWENRVLFDKTYFCHTYVCTHI